MILQDRGVASWYNRRKEDTCLALEPDFECPIFTRSKYYKHSQIARRFPTERPSNGLCKTPVDLIQAPDCQTGVRTQSQRTRRRLVKPEFGLNLLAMSGLFV